MADLAGCRASSGCRCRRTVVFVFLGTDIIIKNTLKTRLTLLLGGLAIGTTVVVATVVTHLASEKLREWVGLNLQEVAVQLRDKIEIDLHERYNDLATAARIANTSVTDGNYQQMGHLLNQLQDNFSYYAWIGMVSPSGDVLASTGNMLQGKNVSQRPWFQEASDHPFIGDAHPALLLESLLEAPSSRPLRFVDVAVPMRAPETDELQGVLGAHLYLDWVAHIGEEFLNPLKDRLGAEYLIANDDNEILIGPDSMTGKVLPDPLRAQQTPGHLRTTMAHGETSTDFLVGYSRLRHRAEYEGLQWLVMVRKPVSEAFAPVSELRNAIIISGLILTPFLGLLGWLAARRVTRPLLKMAREARDLDYEDPERLITNRQDYAEVRHLSDAFRSLIRGLMQKSRQLNALNTDLEQRVEERTRRLEEANTQLQQEVEEGNRMRREREALIRQLEETANTDALTHISNRRHFFELGDMALKRAQRNQEPLTVIMFDVDRFKSINDNHGHAAGDQALIELVNRAHVVLREVDLLARIGGEEFAIVLERTTPEGAREVAERLRETIAATPITLGNTALTVTISAGIASLGDQSSADLDRLMANADKALYRAKAEGRNRVCEFQPGGEKPT